MKLVNLALKALRPQAAAFEKSTLDPMKAQRKVLLQYLARNRATEYGRKYKFAGIGSVKEYQNTVPLSNYESLKPYIDRMAHRGERGVLTSDRVIFFGITSGTTGIPKLIPVTKYSRGKKSQLMNLWAYYINRDHPDVLDGKILAIVSPEVKNFTQAKIPYGPEDGHAYNNLPLFLRNFYVLPYQLFYIPDYDGRYYCMLRIAMEKNITTIATLNPSTLVLLSQRIDRVADRIIRDIEKGTLDRDFDIPAGIRKTMERRLRPNRGRADELRRIVREKGGLLPKDFWPKLRLIECWKGGTVKLYLKELPPYFGNVAVRDFGCLSTEARSSVPMSDAGAGGVLAINTNFYEFVRREDMGRKDKRYFLADELEKGKEYFIIVTTPGGLYRYNIDDVITVDGFFNKTPMIEFVQKGLNAVSLTGEKVYESHINEAVNRAADKHKVLIDFFSASVQMDDPPRYIFLVEFNGACDADKKRGLLRSIEDELCHENSEYKDLREQQLLRFPILKVVKKGQFENYRKMRIRQGAHDGQLKVPELVRDADFQKKFEIEEEIRLD